jgi:hypothetical protein
LYNFVVVSEPIPETFIVQERIPEAKKAIIGKEIANSFKKATNSFLGEEKHTHDFTFLNPWLSNTKKIALNSEKSLFKLSEAIDLFSPSLQ